MLERRLVQIKILSDDKAVIKESAKIAEKTEGVTSVTVNGCVISAEIGEWASDYDVMVAVINGVAENLNAEAEPFTDDDVVAAAETAGEVSESAFDKSDESICKSADEKKNKSDGEEEQNPKKDWIFKISEWGVAVVLFIAGLILAGTEKAYKAAPYLQIVAFTLAGYEVCFSMLSKFFKKNFIGEEAFIILAAIASVVLQKYEYAAAFMIVYGGLQVAIDGVKCFTFAGGAELFAEAAKNRKIKKIGDIYLIIAFASIVAYAFISPVFAESYKTALKSAGLTAVLLAAAVCPFSLAAVRALNSAFALKKARGEDIEITEGALVALEKTKSVLFDINAAEKDGALTEDLDGAVLELYDGGAENVELLSDGDKTHASELRKALNMRKSASMLTDEGKIEEIELNGGKGKTAVYVTAENNAAAASKAAGVTIGLSGADGDVKIADGDVKKIPFVVKLAKRTRKLGVIAAIVSAVVKVALVALILTGFTDNAYLVCGLSTAATLAGLIISLINRTEVN